MVIFREVTSENRRIGEDFFNKLTVQSFDIQFKLI